MKNNILTLSTLLLLISIMAASIAGEVNMIINILIFVTSLSFTSFILRTKEEQEDKKIKNIF